MKKQIYFQNLDGLRFLCFLSVFFCHCFYTNNGVVESDRVYRFVKSGLFANGNIGVNFFFVLSGFLITYLMIEEKKMNGQINLKYFWMRRALRIWPLFYLCVFFGFVIFPLLRSMLGNVPNEIAQPAYYMTFTNNFDYLLHGHPQATSLEVLWSVAVEEQFYLLWPLVIYICPVRKLWIPFLIIISGSLIFRAAYDTRIMHERHTLSCIGDMAVGSCGAWLIGISQRFRNFVVNLKTHHIGFVYVVFMEIYFFRAPLFYNSYGLRIIERLLIAIVILFIILEQTYSRNSLFKMSRFKRITNLGLITYGMYCLHVIAILIADNLAVILKINSELWQVLFIDIALAFLISLVLSKLSFRYFETPFLRLKNRVTFITK